MQKAQVGTIIINEANRLTCGSSGPHIYVSMQYNYALDTLFAIRKKTSYNNSGAEIYGSSGLKL